MAFALRRTLLSQHACISTACRTFSTSVTPRQSAAPGGSSQAPSDSSSSDAVPPLRLSKEQREVLEEMIRVDQAGELGANWIYRGQYAVLGSDKKVGPLLQVHKDPHVWSTLALRTIM